MSVEPRIGDDVADVVAVSGRASRLDVREAGREIRARIARGSRHVVFDLTAARYVAEGQVILVVLALRAELGRRGARVVIAAPPASFEHLSHILTHDDLVDVAPTLADALESRVPVCSGPPVAATADPAPMQCLQCGTTWYGRVAARVIDAGMTCARCGAPLFQAGPTQE